MVTRSDGPFLRERHRIDLRQTDAIHGPGGNVLESSGPDA
jgi:hypothetical protein